ncbi:MAG: polysaccharide deacetylase family protein [Bacteroidales bacterium]|nr:polysaccharide deacetylase family protein [Bacteroidales bacterium]
MTAFVVILIFAFAAIIAREVYAATHIQKGFYVNAQSVSDCNGILLTFDDGPDPENTPKVLDILSKYNVKALFFIIAKNAEQHPEIIRRILNEGHAIGSHTYSHNPFMAFKTSDSYFKELKRADEVFKSLNISTKLFRPPLGITNAMIRKAIDKMNYHVVAWSIRSFDTRKTPRQEVLNRICSQLQPNSIILMHDRMHEADWLTEKVILFAHSRNLSFATPQEAIKY